jgi:peptidoglycan/LPS O-acetylase OafA/YrhL
MPPDAQRSSHTYIASLDGMRAVAILLVVFAHFGFGKIIPGGFGVTIFFFISGFLISRLLIVEYAQNGGINIRYFYIRRVLRLAPALLTMLSIIAIVNLFMGLTVSGYELLAGLTYTMNYYLIAHQSDPILPLGVLWSLAVEEHYYLFFPLFLALLWRKKTRFLTYLVLACIAALIWRTALFQLLHFPEEYTYKATDTRFDSILYGAILAAALEVESTAYWIRRSDALLPLSAACLVLLSTFLWRNAAFRETVRYSLQGMALIPIFYAILYDKRLSTMRSILATAPMVWIGRVSYSLYLWHVPVHNYVLIGFPQMSVTMTYILALPSTFLVAAASYYFVERPFVSLRKSFRRLNASPLSALKERPNESLAATGILEVDVPRQTSPS